SFHCDQSELQSDDNLCLKAARLWSQAAHRVLDCRISLQKTIPTGAGLGGGSGNAAATLVALNSRFDNILSDAQLHELATQLGADVPLFLHGGCALIEGIGERITPLRALEGWLVVLQPEQKLSTPQVFRAFDELNQKSANASIALLQSIEQKASLSRMAKLLQNDLTAAAEKCGVQMQRGLSQLQQSGAVGTSMTGSGSAVFGVFSDEETAHHALSQLQTRGWSFASVAPFCAFGRHEANNRVLDAPHDAFP
ncbi:MAG TPA: 4-(cytidine 5'-diphospho)-2-C-methyl-D-erythritol kinase, partial [Abditibacteriaceae bacterium]|nr:4-(cytidine 5'-diphospho)-2-C-methyl-D-erythritol kinase [Abditibacteriaceae bacterium]